MQAIGIWKHGGPEVLNFVTVPLPSLRPRDLLVRVKAFAVNPADSKRRRGGDYPSQSPQILGFDGAGVVEQTGDETTLFQVGDEVFFAGDARRQGCNAEFVAIDERIVGPKPKSLSFTEAAAVPLTALTVWEAYFENMRLNLAKPVSGRSIFIVGGAGGVGSMAIQIAKRVAGLMVVASAGRPASAEFCRRMGADAIIDYVQEMTHQFSTLGLNGVDYILDCVALTNLPDLISILHPMGIICGIVGREGLNNLDVTSMFAKRGTLTFEYMFMRPYLDLDQELQGRILGEVSKLLDRKILVSTMTQRLDWSDIQLAHQMIESGHTLGKIVLEIPD